MPTSRIVRFYANIGDENTGELSQGIGTRSGLLLSPTTVSSRAVELAKDLADAGIPIAADNGNTALIFLVAGEFHERAQALASRSKAGDAKDLRKEYRTLAEDVAKRCRSFVSAQRQREVLSAQQQVTPGFSTTLEDLTIPVLINLDIERSDTGQHRSTYVSSQKKTLELAKDILEGRMGAPAGTPYATLQAWDYDTAFAVGSLAGKVQGLRGLAVGIASFLTDRSYVDSYIVNGRCKRVPGKSRVPRRYLRMTLVALGLVDGFRNEAGVVPNFHGLGGGAPMVLPFLSLVAFGSPLLSTDSTAPEKNASMGKLAVEKPAPMTVDVVKVAQALVDGRKQWDCPCPYCISLGKKLTFNISAARRVYESRIAPRKIELRDLKEEEGVGRHLSICWETRSDPYRSEIKAARVNHNHWVLANIVSGLESRSSYEARREWVGELCNTYAANTSPTYARQMFECLRIIDRHRP